MSLAIAIIAVLCFVGLVVWRMLYFPASACHEKGTLRGYMECECSDCMEPGLRGPSRTSLD